MAFTREIIRIGQYGISILDLSFVIAIVAADLAILRSVDRYLKKRNLLGSRAVKATAIFGKALFQLGALIGIFRVLGVRMGHGFDFLKVVLSFNLFTISDTQVSLLNLIILAIVVWVSAMLARLVRNYFDRSLLPRFKLEAGLKFSLSKLIGYLIVAIGVVIALQGLGIKMSALAVFAGFIGVGIGFGMQNAVANGAGSPFPSPRETCG